MSKEKEALEKIKGLVRTQVVRNEGEDNTPPSFLDIYNLACAGLSEGSTTKDGATINSCVANSDTP
jgi:hypothetical protein